MGPLCQRKEPKTGKGNESKSLSHETGVASRIAAPVSVGMPGYLGIIDDV